MYRVIEPPRRPLARRPGSCTFCAVRRAGRPRARPWLAKCRAGAADDAGDTSSDREMLNRMMRATETTDTLTGKELRQLIFAKWGKTYEARLNRVGGQMVLQIMWKHLEQQSFPLTEAEYDEQLAAIAELCSLWGVSDVVRNAIAANRKGPYITVGTVAKVVNIPLGRNLDIMGGGR